MSRAARRRFLQAKAMTTREGQLPSAGTFEQLRSRVGRVAESVWLEGYASRDDGGGGLFVWGGSPVKDDGGMSANLGGPGSTEAGWRRVSTGPIDAKWFGAKGDGVTNDTVAIQRAINYAQDRAVSNAVPFHTVTVRLPHGSYLITPGRLELPGYITLASDHNADLIGAANTGPLLRIAGAHNRVSGLCFRGGKHAIALFGASVHFGGNLGHPATVNSVCVIDECTFYYQHGPAVWQDTSQATTSRAIAGHIEIARCTQYGQTLFWGTCDGLTIKDCWCVVDETTVSQVQWDDGKTMGWVCSHGVVSIQDVSAAPASEGSAAWYEGNGIVQSRGWRMGGEGGRVPWRIRSAGMAYGGLALPAASANQLAKVYSTEDAIASTAGVHLMEVYDDFPGRIVIKHPVPFGTGTLRADIEFANPDCTIWIDSVSCPASEWAKSSKGGLLIDFEMLAHVRFVTSAAPGSVSPADVTHVLAGYHRVPSPVWQDASTLENLWPDVAGSGGGDVSVDPSWGIGATGNNVARDADTSRITSIDRIRATSAAATSFKWTSGVSTGPDVNWGAARPAGVYTAAVFVKANFSGGLQFVGESGGRPIGYARFEAGSDWQRLAFTFYHDGADRRLEWICPIIPGTAQPGGAGSIGLGFPMVNHGPFAAPYVAPGAP